MKDGVPGDLSEVRVAHSNLRCVYFPDDVILIDTAPPPFPGPLTRVHDFLGEKVPSLGYERANKSDDCHSFCNGANFLRKAGGRGIFGSATPLDNLAAATGPSSQHQPLLHHRKKT